MSLQYELSRIIDLAREYPALTLHSSVLKTGSADEAAKVISDVLNSFIVLHPELTRAEIFTELVDKLDKNTTEWAAKVNAIEWPPTRYSERLPTDHTDYGDIHIQ